MFGGCKADCYYHGCADETRKLFALTNQGFNMKKIKTLFVIDRNTNLATQTPNEGTDWVFKGEGKATIKYDGTACMFKDGVLYKRYDRKLKKQYTQKARSMGSDFVATDDMFNEVPADAIPCEEKPDPKSFHFPHWVKVSKDNPQDQFHLDAFSKGRFEDGTYELLGPKINGNAYELTENKLVKHGVDVVDVPDRTYEGMFDLLVNLHGEGVVFHHNDGRMVKCRRKDYGLFWNKDDVRDQKVHDKKRFKP